MYTLAEIARLRAQCLELRLEGSDLLELYTNEQLQEICNGIGPEFFPSRLRAAVSALHPTLEPAAFLHDIKYERSDGSWSGFTSANSEFLRNGIRLADASFGWYNPRRYLVRADARRFHGLLTAGGWIAWQQAYAARLKRGAKA